MSDAPGSASFDGRTREFLKLKDPSTSSPEPNLSGRPGWPDWLGFGLLVVATALPALLIYPFPSQDGPQHAFAAFAAARLSDPALGLGAFLDVRFPLSSQGFVFLVMGLDRILPFVVAERLALAVTLAAFPLFGAIYASMVRRPLLPVAGLLALTAYGWSLAMGFFNFLLALAVVPVLVASVEHQRDRAFGSARAVLFGSLLLLLAWLHVAVAALAGLWCLVVALGGRSRLRGLGWVVLAGVPAGLYAVWAATRHAETNLGAGFLTESQAYFEPWSHRLSGLLEVGPGALSPVTGVVAVAGYGLAAAHAARGGGRRPVDLGLLCLAIALVLAYLLAPLHAARWAFLSPRLLLAAGVGFSLISIPVVSAGWRRWVFVALVLLGLSAAGWSLHGMARQLRPVEEAVVAAPHARGAPLLVLEMAERPIPDAPRHVEPTLHLGLRTLMGTGGITPYLFAFNRAAHTLIYKESTAERVGPAPGAYIRRGFRCGGDDARACLDQQTRVADRIAYYGLAWGELLLLHSPELLSFRLRQRGFLLRYSQGPVELWVARPASLTVRLSLPEEPLVGTLIVRLGYPDSVGWVAGQRLAAGTIPPVPLEAHLDGLLPGAAELEVFLDLDGDSEPDPDGWIWRRQAIELRPGEKSEVGIQESEVGETPGRRIPLPTPIGQP